MMNKEIQKGDRIFARLTMAGKPILEFMINTVANMDELLMELRRMTSTLRGLGRLQVRNQSRGWMSVSNLMFYGGNAVADVQSASRNIYTNPVAGRMPSAVRTSQTSVRKASVVTNTKSSHMPFPWETH